MTLLASEKRTPLWDSPPLPPQLSLPLKLLSVLMPSSHVAQTEDRTNKASRGWGEKYKRQTSLPRALS